MYFSQPNITDVPFIVGSEVAHYRDIKHTGRIVAASDEEDALGGRYWRIEGEGFDLDVSYREDFLVHANAHRIQCGCCKGFHPSVRGVKDCYADDAEQEATYRSERAAWPYI